jgi:hypothetical protein
MEECGAQFASSRAILCPATPRLRGQHDARVLFICGQIVRNWCKLLGIIGFQTNKGQTNGTFCLLFVCYLTYGFCSSKAGKVKEKISPGC